MIKKPIWIERTFSLNIPVEILPNIIERLRGTPARLEELVGSLTSEQLTNRKVESWSIQKIAGHLLDLESLWLGRMDDFKNRSEKLRLADMSNAKTESAQHDDHHLARIAELLKIWLKR